MIQSTGLEQYGSQRATLVQSVNRVCSEHEYIDVSSSTINVYDYFLRYVYLNLKENSFNATLAGSSGNATSYVNTVWRTLKGRLYTRLHDKRVGELDSTGLVNLTSLFIVIIRCL